MKNMFIFTLTALITSSCYTELPVYHPPTTGGVGDEFEGEDEFGWVHPGQPTDPTRPCVGWCPELEGYGGVDELEEAGEGEGEGEGGEADPFVHCRPGKSPPHSSSHMSRHCRG